ncbi:DUF4974 domain-containing protein [Echinicola soli]|uniref:DUF4974 domain-containing protein n=1 Tax=Echinicola soli TaxID=2591634 RepID=A0A514CKC8_9BACT|nr:FecR domain-containing protein [Echinicola soli]QDH80262.1 DUF4974 domain-containing protein [Echinicola soli]
MENKHFWILVTRYLSNESTLEENEELQDLVASNPTYKNKFEQAAEAWSRTKQPRSHGIDPEKIKKRVFEKTTKSKGLERRWLSWKSVKLAAGIVILFVLSMVCWINLPEGTSPIPVLTQVTENGQKTTLTLGDGTVVRLNSGSRLTYPSQFSDSVRRVTLEGEAFFEVMKDSARPFRISTGDLTTTVLGTSFNISTFDPDLTRVTVKSGKVMVADASGKDRESLYLLPGEQAVYHTVTSQLFKREVDLETYMGWKDGIITLDQVSLGEAVETLERWYGVAISFENPAIAHCRISGKYNNDKLVNILENLVFVLDMDYQFIDRRQIMITGQPCP